MSVDSGGYSPSGSKPAAVVADWQAHGLPIEICDFQPVTAEDLCLAHDTGYVDAVLSGWANNGHGNNLPEVTGACLWTCGSMVAAARAAMVDGIACSPSSGFHHAGYDSGGGFCTFNGLIVTVEKLRTESVVNKVGIIDCDAHYGNGTDDIIELLNLGNHIQHWTFGREFGWMKDFRQHKLLSAVGRAIKKMKAAGVDLILYQAGADPHVDDPLGGYMTTDEMRERDAFVFDACRAHGMPVAWNLAGGYQRDADGRIDAVLDLHRATATEALRARP